MAIDLRRALEALESCEDKGAAYAIGEALKGCAAAIARDDSAGDGEIIAQMQALLGKGG